MSLCRGFSRLGTHFPGLSIKSATIWTKKTPYRAATTCLNLIFSWAMDDCFCYFSPTERVKSKSFHTFGIKRKQSTPIFSFASFTTACQFQPSFLVEISYQISAKICISLKRNDWESSLNLRDFNLLVIFALQDCEQTNF